MRGLLLTALAALALAAAGLLLRGLPQPRSAVPALPPGAEHPEVTPASTGSTGRQQLAVDAPPAGAPPRPKRLATAGSTLPPAWPAITGRVTTPEGAPVEDAVLHFTLQGHGRRTPGTVPCGAEGVFRVPLHLHGTPVELARLDARGPDGGRALARLHDIPAGGLEIGELRLESTSSVHFLVLDASGAPLRDATVRTLEDSPVVSAPADAEGRCVLRHLSSAVGRCRASAPEHRSAVVELAPGGGHEGEPIEVRLLPLPGLRVEVVAPAGGPLPRGFELHLDLPDPASFLGEDGERTPPPENDHRARSALRLRSTTRTRPDPGTAPITLVYEVPADGEVLVPGLLPVSPFDARLVDALGQTVEQRRIRPAALVDREVLRIELARRPIELTVVVRDERGEPVEGAAVRSLPSRARSGTTDPTGEAHFAPVAGGRVDLEVRKQGFVPAVLAGVSPGEARIEVHLERGLAFRVAAADPTGLPVRLSEVVVRDGATPLATSTAPGPDGVHLIEGVPARPIHVSARVGHARASRVHDPRAGDLLLEVPAVGGMEILLDSPPAIPLWIHLSAEGVPGASQLAHHPSGGPRRVDLGAVIPGSYSLEIRVPEGGELRTVLRRQRIEVRAGETTRVPVAVTSLGRD